MFSPSGSHLLWEDRSWDLSNLRPGWWVSKGLSAPSKPNLIVWIDDGWLCVLRQFEGDLSDKPILRVHMPIPTDSDSPSCARGDIVAVGGLTGEIIVLDLNDLFEEEDSAKHPQK